MDMSKVQRALGVIEGVCIGLPDKPAELIEAALCEIDCELEGGGTKIPVSKDHLTMGERDELVERLYNYLRKMSPLSDMKLFAMAEDCARAASLIEQLQEQLKDRDYDTYVQRN